MNRRTLTTAMVFGGTALALGQVGTRAPTALAGGWASLELINPLQVAIVGIPTVVDAQVLQHGVSPSAYFPATIRFVHDTSGAETLARLEIISEEFAISRGEFTLAEAGLYRMTTHDMGPEVDLGVIEVVQPATGDVVSELLTQSSETMEASSGVATETDILESSFAEPVLEVPVSTTVRWRNASVLPHQVKFEDSSIATSPMLKQNDSFSVMFDAPGEYAYFCAPHPHMTGVVRVR
jgi:plastocyanin